MNQNSQQLDAVVIGAGQAGLAAGYHLARAKLRFEILEEAPRVGETWRRRWDSLRLFTPAQHNGLPGLPFPAARNSYPGKDEFAAYLENYASHFGLPVRTGVRVDGVTAAGSGFAVDTARGTVRARNVIVAAGANVPPRIPDAAAGLDRGISQLHSSHYRGPADIPDGDVLVVAPAPLARKSLWSSRPGTGCCSRAGPPRIFPTRCSATPAGRTGGSSTRY